MSEAALNFPSSTLSMREGERVHYPITLYHMTLKDHVDSIMEHGLIAGEKAYPYRMKERTNTLIDLYCRLFGTPVNRSNSVYASLDDPRFVDVDNNASYEQDKHAVVALQVNSNDAYVAESDYYAMAMAHLSEFSFIKAHIAAIQYVRSIQPYEDYIKNGPKHTGYVPIPKPEVLIPRFVPTSSLKAL